MHVALHKAEHLFDYIESYEKETIPSNLTLLEEHISLNELTQSSDIVATTFSAAIYPDVISKKVIFLNGFSSIDTEYYKGNYVSFYYNYLRETGRVVNYEKFADELRNAKEVDKHELSLLYVNLNKPVSEIIYEVISFIVYNIVKEKYYPA